MVFVSFRQNIYNIYILSYIPVSAIVPYYCIFLLDLVPLIHFKSV